MSYKVKVKKKRRRRRNTILIEFLNVYTKPKENQRRQKLIAPQQCPIGAQTNFKKLLNMTLLILLVAKFD